MPMLSPWIKPLAFQGNRLSVELLHHLDLKMETETLGGVFFRV
jgi:hypothetical protein